MKTATTRWRSWKPPANEEKFEKPANIDPTKPTKVPSNLVGIDKKFSNMGSHDPTKLTEKTSPGSLAEHDPAAWDADFGIWLSEQCTFRDRIFWSVRHLHGLFCTWCAGTDRVPCRLDTFEELLRREDILAVDGLLYGVMPKDELRWIGKPGDPPSAR